MKGLFKGCLTIPNLMGVIRILLVPAFLVLYFQGRPFLALLMIAISGLTDFFDGKIARRFNQISELGKLLDPIADKATQIAVAVALFVKFMQTEDPAMEAFGWVFLLFIFKEISMLIAGALLLSRDIRPVASEVYGKAATFIFYTVMLLVIGFGPGIGALSSYNINMTMPMWMVITLVIISLILTFVALFSYFPPTIRQIKEKREQIILK